MMIEAHQRGHAPSASRGGRWWGVGALIEPWLTSLDTMGEDVPGWLLASLLRAGGKVTKRWLGLPTVPLSSIAGDEQARAEPILDGVCLPPFVASPDHSDFEALMRIVSALRPQCVLEFGTAYGNTVANICRQCPSARVFTVNAPPEEISGVSITYALTRDEIGSVYRRYGFSDRVVQIWCNTLQLDLSQYLSGPTVDLAIIDACHDRKYVLNDFLKTVPYMKPNAMVLLHDTHPSMVQHLRGSYTACMLLRRRGFDIQQIEHTWWGVWTNVVDDVVNRCGAG